MVVGWLTKVAITLAVLGVLLFDATALLIGRVSVADHADTAAQAAGDSWRDLHSYPAALLAAQVAAHGDEIVPDSLVIATDGSTRLVLRQTVNTLVVRHIPQLETLNVVTEAGAAHPPAN
ncbi:MAG TPA: hypothetical protein VLR26_07220 [Frankiaceae bacterium]|nr:hypothetical protein [Frankiaceae bacterium]